MSDPVVVRTLGSASKACSGYLLFLADAEHAAADVGPRIRGVGRMRRGGERGTVLFGEALLERREIWMATESGTLDDGRMAAHRPSTISGASQGRPKVDLGIVALLQDSVIQSRRARRAWYA